MFRLLAYSRLHLNGDISRFACGAKISMLKILESIEFDFGELHHHLDSADL